MSIKLSIAIPTYNGSRYIREALDSIISQLDDIDEEVEIVVSDNASTDQTPEIIREYQNKYSFIKYFRNEENIGADRNFDLAIRRSAGEYVWLFSDDDVMVLGGVRKSLNVLNGHPELAAIFVNWGNYSPDLKQCNIERTIDIQEDIFFKTADDFLSTVRLNPIFVSSNIIRRSLWEQTHCDIHMGSNWIHYATLLTIIAGHYSYCIAEPYVMYRTGNIHWDKLSETSIKNTISLMKIVNGLTEKGYSKMSVSKARAVIIRSLPREIIVLKVKGVALREFHIKDMIAQFKRYPSFWMVDLPLLFIPNTLYEVAYRVYRIKAFNGICRALMSKAP